MVDAATQFRKSGYSDEDAANLALVATMYQNIADQEISAGDAASFIVSQMKAFGIESDNAMHIIDAVNEVSNNFAVSSTDVSTALSKTSAAMSVLGNDYEQTIGLVTAGTEILTGQASKVAKGLRTIGNNFANAAQKSGEIEYSVGGVTKSLSLLDETTGDLKPTFEIFKDLKTDWDNMSDAERQAIGIAYAGKNQFEVFAAVMENFETALKATETAYNSSGSAAEENEKAMESLEGKTRILKAAWEDFATNTITKEFIGSILDAGTALLNFANTDMGRAITKAVLFGTTLGAGVGFVGTFAGKIFELFGEMKKLGKAIDGPTTLLGKFLSVGTKGKWTLVALGIAGITAAILGLNEVLGVDKFEKYIEKIGDIDGEIEEYEGKLAAAKNDLEELQKIPWGDRSAEQQEEINRLQYLVQYYNDLIELKNQERQTTLKKAGRELQEAEFSKGVPTLGFYSIEDFSPASAEQLAQQWADYYDVDYAEALGKLTKSYNDDAEAIREISDFLGISFAKFGEDAEKGYKKAREALQDWGVDVRDTSVSIERSFENFRSYNSALANTENQTQENVDAAKRLLLANEDIRRDMEAYIEEGGELSEEQQKWATEYDNLNAKVNNAQLSINRLAAAEKYLSEVTGGMPSAFDNTAQSLRGLAYALVNNAELGIASVDDLKTVLSSLGNRGLINFDSIEGGLEGLLSWLQTLEGFDLPPKELDITAGEVEGVEESVAAVGEPEIVANITTVADATELATALENINTQLSSLPTEAAKVTIKADISDVNSKIGEIKTAIENASGEVEVTVQDSSSGALDNLGKIDSLLGTLASKQTTVKVEADTALALARLNVISNYRISNKSVTVSCYDYTSHILQGIIDKLKTIQNKTVTVTTIHENRYVTTGLPGARAKGDDNFAGGLALINDGAPVNGSSGELVVSNGMGTIYNNGEETVQNLPRGAKIYTAAETQKILKSRGLTVSDLDGNVIPAFANGTRGKYPDYRLDPNYSGTAWLSGSGETLKENFDNWLKEKKHFLALDIISEAQYYRDLEIMNERYLKNMADYRDDYWKHEEEIYDWRNQSLEEQITLEEKLSELAKAKTQRVLTYTGGRFQYLQNIEAIAAAQREVDRLTGRYADGTLNARGGLSLVGEEGPELRVLKSGDGIVPADATKNLLSLSRFNAKDIIGAAKSNIMQYAFNISNLSLPNVQSPEDFVSGLRNLAYQYSFGRT